MKQHHIDKTNQTTTSSNNITNDAMNFTIITMNLYVFHTDMSSRLVMPPQQLTPHPQDELNKTDDNNTTTTTANTQPTSTR